MAGSFTTELDMIKITNELKKKEEINRHEIAKIVMIRRDIAHELDIGTSIKDIPYNKIKVEKI